jgi:hypothetical protein
VAHHLRRELRLPALRIASVTGRLPASEERRCEEYFVLAAPAARRLALRVEPRVLLDLIDGYWEGWLPDGLVSLK